MLSLPTICTVAYIWTIVVNACPVVFTQVSLLTFINIYKRNTSDNLIGLLLGGGRVKKCSFGWVICICLYWAVDFDIFFLPFKQFWSFHPVVQSQIYDPTVLTQVPLFWQGENWHSSKSKIIRDNTGWYSYNKIKL